MEIVEFEPAHAEAFRALNEAWISKYFTLEPKDLEALADPQGEDPGQGRAHLHGPEGRRRGGLRGAAEDGRRRL